MLFVLLLSALHTAANSLAQLPKQSVFVDPASFAVLGPNGAVLNDTQPFNPTNTTPPFFQIFSNEFLSVLGSSPSITLIAENDTFAFAHEAPVWIPQTNEVFFCSNAGGALGMSDLNHNNQVSKISLADAEKVRKNGGLVKFTKVPLDPSIQMTNGGTNFRGQLLLINSGRGPLPSNIALVNPIPPFNSTVLLDNYFGRQFNSLNDIKVHPTNKLLFFTDAPYGALQNFRPPLAMPNQLYRLDPDTGRVKVVLDGLDKNNGLAFSADGKIAFVCDTGAQNAFLGINQVEPASIYQFDVDPVTNAFKNRRIFAYADTGFPDGIQLDTKGNVYAGTGEGVSVWNPSGELIGKIFVGTTSANFIFAGPGTLVVLAETKVFLVKFAANGLDLPAL